MDESAELFNTWAEWQDEFRACWDRFQTRRDAYQARVACGEEAADDGDWATTDQFLKALGRPAAAEIGAGTRGPTPDEITQLLLARQLVARLEHPPEKRVRLFAVAWVPPVLKEGVE